MKIFEPISVRHNLSIAYWDGFMLGLLLRRCLSRLFRLLPSPLQRSCLLCGRPHIPSMTSRKPVYITSLKFCGAGTSML